MYKRLHPYPKKTAVLLIICLLIVNTFSFAETYPTQWDLTKIFANENAFHTSVQRLNRILIPELEQYKGKLTNQSRLYEFFSVYKEASILSDRLYVYASMLQDTDTTNSTYQEYAATALDAYANLEEATSFLKPELLAFTDDALVEFSSAPELKAYKSYFLGLVNARPYILSEDAENILALSTEFSEMPSEIYDQLTISDVHYDIFLDPLGKSQPFNFDIDTIYFYSDQVEDRIKANEAYMKPYSLHANTIASIYIAEVQKNIFLSKSRGFDSVLEFATSGIIEPDQYRNLIKATRAQVNLIQQYNEIKQKSLGYDVLHTSDLHLPYATAFNMDVSFEDSIIEIKNALSPLGEFYVNQLDDFLKSGSIDVYPDAFKTSSQYTWGAYDTPTFILLNFTDDFSSESTLAHELGHAMHQMYTTESQNYFDTNVGSFPSEATSTLNELLLLESLKNKAEDQELKLFYLEKELELYYETFFMQTILADFEMRVYDEAEMGNPLSLQGLNELWIETSKDYYGDKLVLDDSYQYQWMQIPHLYQTFYVYSYAMSLAASTAIKDQLMAEGDNYQQKYLEFLKSGASLSPAEQMMSLGINLDSPNFYGSLFKHFDGLLTEMDQSLDSLGYYKNHPSLKYLYTSEEIQDAYKQYYSTETSGGVLGDIPSEYVNDDSNLDLIIGFVILLLLVLVFIYALVITLLYASKSKELKKLEEVSQYAIRRLDSFDDRY